MILAFKLLATPLFICLITLAGRRWGPTASGLLIGLPLTSGPVSLLLALQYGAPFATRAATGNVAGQISMCLFCLVYYVAAKRLGWLLCSAAALLAFSLATFALGSVAWTLPSAFVLLSCALPLFLRLMPAKAAAAEAAQLPRWDLPARAAIATAFVLALTKAAQGLGPLLSGLLSPLPAFTLVIAAFTLRQQGGEATGLLLRGVVRSSWANAVFFVAVGLLLPRLALIWTYLAATVAAIGASGSIVLLPRLGRARGRAGSESRG